MDTNLTERETAMKKISIVGGCYNEAENVFPMSEAILSQMDFLPGYDYEILFIDNCSTDGTREKLSAMCARNRKIKAILRAQAVCPFAPS